MKTWQGGRRPVSNPVEEAQRKASYWAWLEEVEVEGHAIADFVAYSNDTPFWWRRLLTPDHADFEARHMGHSIGHSWDLYSCMGELYSLRG